MWVVTAAGFGTRPPTSARASLRLRLLLSALPTAKVSALEYHNILHALTHITIDANGFKEAFIKAQQENEALFKTTPE